MREPEIDNDPTCATLPPMDLIVTLRKQEMCQVIIRNVPASHVRPRAEWLELALSARGKDWEEDDIEVDSVEIINPGMDGLSDVEFKPMKAV